MKKVIFTEEQQTIDVNELTNDSIIGFKKTFTCGNKTSYKCGVFKTELGFFYSSTNQKNIKLYYTSLKELIKHRISTPKSSNEILEFFEFETSKELFKWLGE